MKGVLVLLLALSLGHALQRGKMAYTVCFSCEIFHCEGHIQFPLKSKEILLSAGKEDVADPEVHIGNA